MIGVAGLGDPLNAYPQSMAWYRDRLYVGTTRANLCMLKASKIKTKIENWPVECPDNLYDLDMRAQIHAHDPEAGGWREVFRSPMIDGSEGEPVPREMGYRCMTLFQGASDPAPALYASTYASARGKGTNILRSVDGATFTPVSKPEAFGDFVTTLRLLVPFKGRLFTSPTGRAGGNPNTAFHCVVYETRDPVAGEWVEASAPGFGDPSNLGLFEMAAFGDHLYAGTGRLNGFQLWRTDAEGDPPYRWQQVLSDGAYRGKENQGVASLQVFNDALYVGGGIQHGGIDVANKVGPAGPELIRVHGDGSWDLIVGVARDTPVGRKEPLSGFGPGFDNPFNGYFWRMGVHDGWIFVGTYNWSLMLNFASQDGWPELMRQVYRRVGAEAMWAGLAGAELYRSRDGDNWLAVTTNGFDNPYNYGIRTLVSTPAGLAVGTVNPFAPRVAQITADGFRYRDNPRGGLEVWLGAKSAGRGGRPRRELARAGAA